MRVDISHIKTLEELKEEMDRRKHPDQGEPKRDAMTEHLKMQKRQAERDRELRALSEKQWDTSPQSDDVQNPHET